MTYGYHVACYKKLLMLHDNHVISTTAKKIFNDG